MLKCFSICAALVVLGAGTVNAQQQEAILQKLEVPGADFDVIFAMAKSPAAAPIDLRAQPDPLVVYLGGGELAMAVDGEVEKMFKDIGSLQAPISIFYVDHKDGKGSKPVAVYIVPKSTTSVSLVR